MPSSEEPVMCPGLSVAFELDPAHCGLQGAAVQVLSYAEKKQPWKMQVREGLSLEAPRLVFILI